VLVFALPGADGITFIRQAEDLGLLAKVKVAFLGFGELYLGAFGEGKAQDMWVALPFAQSLQTDPVRKFVADIQKSSGSDKTAVSQYAFTHYVSLHAAKLAFEKSKSIDGDALVDGLEGIVVDSPTGKVTVGKDHHVTLEMFTAKTEGAGLVVVDDLGQIAPQPGCT
jgi:ABC-type branched-subunit amino acid transport system substrate-binding protein